MNGSGTDLRVGGEGNWSSSAYHFVFVSASVNQLPYDVTVSFVACYMKGCLTACHCVNLSQHRSRQVLRNCALIMENMTTISTNTTTAAASNNNSNFLC